VLSVTRTAATPLWNLPLFNRYCLLKRVSARTGEGKSCTAGEGHQYKGSQHLEGGRAVWEGPGAFNCRKCTFIPSCQGFRTEIIFKGLKSSFVADFKRSRTQKVPCNVVHAFVHPQRLDTNYWRLLGALWLKIFSLALLLTVQNRPSLLSMSAANSSM